MINRTDFFALLFFQIIVTCALAQVLANRPCTDCDARVEKTVVLDQLVLVEH